MTSKQRAYLKSLAMTQHAIFQIGKSSLTPENTKAIDEALEARELIKISVLQNCMDDPAEIARGKKLSKRRLVQLEEAVIPVPQQRVDARRTAMAELRADQSEAHISEYAPKKLKVSGALSRSPSRPSTASEQTSASISK